jgi:hypothetical protein
MQGIEDATSGFRCGARERGGLAAYRVRTAAGDAGDRRR